MEKVGRRVSHAEFSHGQVIRLVSVTHYLPLQAKEMVELSRSIANKIKDKQGDITEDEVSLKTGTCLIV